MKKEKGQQNASPQTYTKQHNKTNPQIFEPKLTQALARLKTPRCRRVLQYIAMQSDATTGQIATNCAVGNVSDAVARINAVLKPLGLQISSRLPSPPIKNKFHEFTNMHKWRLETAGGEDEKL